MDFWSFFWLLVWSFLFVAYLMMLFHIFGDIFRDRELGGFAKVVWVVVLFVVPLLASLVDVIVRGTAVPGQGTAGQRRDHPGRVRRDQGQGSGVTPELGRVMGADDRS